MAAFAKTVVLSLQLILVTAVLSIGYGFITRGRFTLAYVFTANFLIGAGIICVALVMKFFKVRFKFDKLTDHSTFNERFMEQYKQTQEKAHTFLFLGLLVIILTGVIQIILAAAIPAN